MPDSQTNPNNPFSNFGQNPIRQYNHYFKSLQFSPTERALVHDLDRAMLALNDDITPTIESFCREWQGVKVWPVLFVR